MQAHLLVPSPLWSAGALMVCQGKTVTPLSLAVLATLTLSSPAQITAVLGTHSCGRSLSGIGAHLVCSTNRTPTERVKSFTLQARGCQSEVQQNQGRMVMWVDKMKFSPARREMRKMKTIQPASHEAPLARFQGRSLCQFRVPAGNR